MQMRYSLIIRRITHLSF